MSRLRAVLLQILVADVCAFVLHSAAGLLNLYRVIGAERYRMPIAAGLLVLATMTFALLWITRAKPRSKHYSREMVDIGVLATNGTILLCDSLKSRKGVWHVDGVAPGRYQIRLVQRRYAKDDVETESIIIARGEPAGKPVKQGEVVVDSGFLMVVDGEAMGDAEVRASAEQAFEAGRGRPRTTGTIRNTAGEVVGISLVPPYGDGSYPVFVWHDDMGVSRVECKLVDLGEQ